MATHNVNPGDLVASHGRQALATSHDRVQMVYDAEDYELMRAGLEGGTAKVFVDVVYADGSKGRVQVDSGFRVISRFNPELPPNAA